MKEKLFNIEVFSKKSTVEKIDYLFRSLLKYPTKNFKESPLQLERRVVKFKESTDLENPMAKDMKYLLGLMKKYKVTGEEDHLIISEYDQYKQQN